MVRLQKSNPSHEWLIHKNLLCHHTTYFKDVLIDGCDTISMIAWSDSSVEFFVQWLYQGDITYDLSLHFENSRPIVDLYYMAQDLKIHALANLAIDHFRQICNRYRVVPDVANLQHVYSKLRGRTPLRVLVARMVAHYVLTSDPSRQSETSRKFWLFAATHAEFGIDFTAALQREVANGLLDPAAGDGEMYHELENADGGSWCPAIDGDDRPYVRASSASSSPPPPYSRDIQ